MNVIVHWEMMLWSSDAVQHEGYYGLGWMLRSSDAVEHERDSNFRMGALVLSPEMQSNMNVFVWAWMLWSSDAVEQERYHGLGMDALVVIRCSRA